MRTSVYGRGFAYPHTGAMFAGQVSSAMPDANKAQLAAKRLYHIIKSFQVRAKLSTKGSHQRL